MSLKSRETAWPELLKKRIAFLEAKIAHARADISFLEEQLTFERKELAELSPSIGASP